MEPDQITPVEQHGNIWVKREDLVRPPIAGGPPPVGGKLRQAWGTFQTIPKFPGIVGYGGRRSNTGVALAAAGAAAGVPVRFHTAAGTDTPEIDAAKKWGATVIRHRPGYLSLVRKRAEDDAVARNWMLGPLPIPAIEAVTRQVRSLRDLPCKRLVLAVGAGLTLLGVAAGLKRYNLAIPILAVSVGAKVTLPDEFSPGWDVGLNIVWRKPKADYARGIVASVGELRLHPLYEAKTAEFLEPGDLLWNLGIAGEQQ